MTDKELRRLRRQDLLQLLVEQSKEAARLQMESNEKRKELAQLNEGYERLKDKLDEKDEQLGTLKERLNEKDALLEKLKNRLDEKDALLEKLKSRLDEKDGLLDELSGRLETLRSDKWGELNSDGLVTNMIENYLKTALFEREKSKENESHGKKVHE